MSPAIVEDTPCLRPCYGWTMPYPAAESTGWGAKVREGGRLTVYGRRGGVVAYVSRVGDCWRVVSGWGTVDVGTSRRPVGRFGGWRESMICPVCYRRCEVLFLVAPGPRCRRCGKLGYKQQYDRHERKGREIMKRHGWEGLVKAAEGGNLAATVALVNRAILPRTRPPDLKPVHT